ncbi:hypothetical protein [Paenibacillus oleatilyticus]|uniref:hypothetical protein n=1 Tax=Paenibacillus oleatilyticus TaxID=2594886 RepID=UPI001C1F90F8|nr:hypothetical protein [Paenibacillus oleatilyticus]MBU7318468.1 hypothetical protein [Paenibacillus oleatilyticus]
MTVPVICIAIAVILVIALIMYNMRSMMSSPVPRSERQFPGHSEEAPGKGPQAEAPAGPAVQEAVAAKRPPAEQKRGPQPSAPQRPEANQERAEATTVQVPPKAEQEAEVRAAAQKPIAQSGRERTPEAADAEAARTSAKLADPEYRQALRGFAQPARPASPSGKAGEAPMKDDDFRTALRSMHNKK